MSSVWDRSLALCCRFRGDLGITKKVFFAPSKNMVFLRFFTIAQKPLVSINEYRHFYGIGNWKRNPPPHVVGYELEVNLRLSSRPESVILTD